MAAGARQADVEEPSLLGERVVVVAAWRIGSVPSSSAGEEHGVPLEPLGPVERQQVHAVGRALRLGRGPRGELREERRRPSISGRAAADLAGDLQHQRQRRGPLPCLGARERAVGVEAQVVRGGAPRGRRRAPARASRAGSAPQEPQRLADLAPLEEALAADAERDPGLREGRLDRRELGVHPDQDRDLGGRRPARHEPADRRREQGELGVPVGAAPDRRRRPGRLGGHEPLAAPLRGEEAVRERKDLRAAPVVAVQGHLAGRRVAGREARQERRRGAGEGVDRLVLVADDAQVVAIAQPQLEEALLERVRVLVLVDAEPAVARPDRLGRRRRRPRAARPSA